MSLFLARKTMWGNYKLNCLRFFGQVDVGERVKAGQVMSLNPGQLVAAKVDLLEVHHGLGGVE